MWNSTGTVSVTNGSPVVSGAGTVFSFPNAQPGQAFVGPNGLPMEIASVDSASQITLARPYGGATAAGQPFTILPTQSFANDLALAFAGFKNTAGAMLDTIGQGMFPDGTVAAPGIRFSADQDTGLRRLGSNIMALVGGGVDRLTLDGDGATVSTGGGPARLTIAATADAGRGGSILFTRAGAASGFIGDAGAALGGTETTGLVYYTYGGDPHRFFAGGAERMRVTNAGAVGIGTATPAAKHHVNESSPAPCYSMIGNPSGMTRVGVRADGASQVLSYAGQPLLLGSDNLGGVVTEWGRFDTNGNLVIGNTAASAYHRINKDVAAGSPIFEVARYGNAGLAVYSSVGASGSPAACSVSVGSSTTTGRSINAGGTINASGADYAEYVRKSLTCGTILKGDVCGIDSNGELTRTWADARRYVVKSTDPNLVGGDTWAAHLGPRPEAPLYAAPAYDGPAEPVEPTIGADATAQQQQDFANAFKEYRIDVVAYNRAQEDHRDALIAAEAAHTAALGEHAEALAAWEAELEAARQTVDRIAFSGQVPVNVDADTLAACHAALGDGVAVYLVAVAHGDGIGATAVRETDMTLPLYMRRIGAVWAIRDGRPWVDVQHG